MLCNRCFYRSPTKLREAIVSVVSLFHFACLSTGGPHVTTTDNATCQSLVTPDPPALAPVTHMDTLPYRDSPTRTSPPHKGTTLPPQPQPIGHSPPIHTGTSLYRDVSGYVHTCSIGPHHTGTLAHETCSNIFTICRLDICQQADMSSGLFSPQLCV